MDIVIVGAGGFGRELLDVVRAAAADGASLNPVGYVDDGEPDERLLAQIDAELLGPVSLLEDLAVEVVIGVGEPRTRRRIDERLRAWGRSSPVLRHPLASTGAACSFGPGTILTAGSRATTNVRLGRHAQLHVNSAVGHDVRASDYLTISPGATISGEVTIGDDVLVGTNAATRQGVTIGNGCTVGAGAVVVDDIEDGSTVVGVPARRIGRA